MPATLVSAPPETRLPLPSEDVSIGRSPSETAAASGEASLLASRQRQPETAAASSEASLLASRQRQPETTAASSEASVLASLLPSHRVRPPRPAAAVVRRARARPALASYDGDALGGAGLGVHAPADPGRPRPARVRRVARAVAHARVTGCRAGRGGHPRMGSTRLSAPGDAAARGRRRDRRAARRRGPRHLRSARRSARSRRLHRVGGARLRLRPSPGGARHQRPACPGPPGHRRGVPTALGDRGREDRRRPPAPGPTRPPRPGRWR